MVYSWHHDAEGLQVVPDQAGLHVVPDKVGLEVARAEERHYEYGHFLHKAYGREEKIWAARSNDSTLPESVEEEPKPEPQPEPTRPRVWRTYRLPLLVVFLLLLGGVAAGVGVGITRKPHDASAAVEQNPPVASNTPTASNQTQTNTTGSTNSTPDTSPRSARKDTGVLAFYPATENDLVWLYWQDRTNDIRSLTYSYDGIWQNSARLPVDDALNGTALAGTFYYALDAAKTTAYMLMYVDKNGILQNLMSDMSNQTWTKGNLGSYKFSAPTDRRVALSTRWRYDVDNGTGLGGLLLMAGGMDGAVHEYLYFYNNQTWREGAVFAGTNGYAAAEPYVDNSNGIAYLTAVTNGSSPELEIWWQSFQNNTLRPWTRGADSIGSVRANTSMGSVSDIGSTFYVDEDMGLVSALCWNLLYAAG